MVNTESGNYFNGVNNDSYVNGILFTYKFIEFLYKYVTIQFISIDHKI